MKFSFTQEFAAFIILESRNSIWEDEYFNHYQYSSRIPNGKQIKEGDLLLIAKAKKEVKSDKQIYAFCTVKKVIIQSVFLDFNVLKAEFGKVFVLNDSYSYSDFIKSCGISRNSIKKIPQNDLFQTIKIILNDISN
jgi:hypothetical protein